MVFNLVLELLSRLLLPFSTDFKSFGLRALASRGFEILPFLLMDRPH